MTLEIGLTGRAEAVVDETNTAEAAGSGTLRVFGTPFLTALMEKAASESLQQTLAEGMTSVGTKLDISHNAATPVGMRVYAESRVTAVEDRRVSFHVTAYDEAGEIGSGTHERVIVDAARFTVRCYGKLEK